VHAQALDALGKTGEAIQAAERAAELGAKSRHSEEYKTYVNKLKENQRPST
jgi:hypothetical protein